MRLKILVTGKNRKVAGDICEHLENDRGYLTVKCNPSKAELFDLVLAKPCHAEWEALSQRLFDLTGLDHAAQH